MTEERVRVIGQVRIGGPAALAIEDLAEVGVLCEPRRDFGIGMVRSWLDKRIGRHSRARLEVWLPSKQVPLLPLEFGDELVATSHALVRRDLRKLCGQAA